MSEYNRAAPITVHFEGVEWSLDDFIDSHDFERFDYDRSPDLPALATADVPAIGLMPDGSIIEALSSALPWQRLVAWKPQDHYGDRCCRCGTWVDVRAVMTVDEDGYECDNCFYEQDSVF